MLFFRRRCSTGEVGSCSLLDGSAQYSLSDQAESYLLSRFLSYIYNINQVASLLYRTNIKKTNFDYAQLMSEKRVLPEEQYYSRLALALRAQFFFRGRDSQPGLAQFCAKFQSDQKMQFKALMDGEKAQWLANSQWIFRHPQMNQKHNIRALPCDPRSPLFFKSESERARNEPRRGKVVPENSSLEALGFKVPAGRKQLRTGSAVQQQSFDLDSVDMGSYRLPQGSEKDRIGEQLVREMSRRKSNRADSQVLSRIAQSDLRSQQSKSRVCYSAV